VNITLREIDRENYRAIGKLKVADNQQRFVATNPWSMVQSKYEPDLTPLGVYDGDTPVGFVMYCDEDYGVMGRAWSIWRVMIDQTQQGRGYGRAAMEALLARLRANTTTHTGIFISFVPENIAARNLYTSLGFEDTGMVEDGELVFRLPLTKSSP
jgi:diamine N-acetyltransferase